MTAALDTVGAWFTGKRALNIAILSALLFATYMNWSWPWGLLFIYWIVPSLIYGEAHLIDPISRADEPILFWAISFVWVLLGVLMVLVDVAPDQVNNFYGWMWGD